MLEENEKMLNNVLDNVDVMVVELNKISEGIYNGYEGIPYYKTPDEVWELMQRTAALRSSLEFQSLMEIWAEFNFK